MLIIGHRGADSEPENSLESLRAGVKAGADMLEFDVRATRDGVVVLCHDFHTYRTHRSLSLVSRSTWPQLQARVAPLTLTTLEEVLDEFYGKSILNIEIKSAAACPAAIALLTSKYIKHENDWANILFSSFRSTHLAAIRKLAPHAKLALLQHVNTRSFVAHHKMLNLSAVGFHKLCLDPFAIAEARRLKLLTYVYTINKQSTARQLERRGIDAIVTDKPQLFTEN